MKLLTAQLETCRLCLAGANPAQVGLLHGGAEMDRVLESAVMTRSRVFHSFFHLANLIIPYFALRE